MTLLNSAAVCLVNILFLCTLFFCNLVCERNLFLLLDLSDFIN